MFRQLLSALTSSSGLERAFSELTEMLDHGAWMFVRANEVLESKAPPEEVREAIYRRDLAINDLERSIRRKVLRHLTVNPGYDVPISLALITVARDAERIGDYCKNVFEVGAFYNLEFHVPKYQEPLERISQQTQEMFALVSAGCSKSDEDKARQALESSKEIRAECDRIVQDLLEDEDQDQINFHEAVAYSLLARHYKRVAAHLANIATAVLGELEHLDLEPEDNGE